MFIQTEQTPNPASLKFLTGCQVMLRGTAEFKSAETASASPLAERIFGIKNVAGVFLGSDFITVTKTSDSSWDDLKPLIMGALMEHFTKGYPVMLNETISDSAVSSIADDDSDIVKQIKELLDTRIRPVVAQDGGDIEFQSFSEGIVYLHMRGACSGCPSSTATLKGGIERMLKHFLPEVEEVRAV